MGYADGYYYGQGKIICDTATFTAGDKIRVRSMTDATKIWDKTVVTAGTPLIFDVPGKDYYKICTVQEISDVETEIAGVYKTIDYGQTLFINVLDKTTLPGIQAILNAHQEATLLSIGDETEITVNGSSWTMQIANIDGTNHAIELVSKHLWDSTTVGGGNNTSYATASPNYLKSKMDDFYNAISQGDKAYIKEVTKSSNKSLSQGYDSFTAYVYPPAFKEVSGTYPHNTSIPPIEQVQFALFATQANRIKTLNGSSMDWWTSDGYSKGGSGSDNWWGYVSTTGACSGVNRNSSAKGVLPCFRMTADA